MTTEELLKTNGVRPSIQRVIIYDALAATKQHPSVTVLYAQLQPNYPSLSKTTVYNTLKVFLAAGIIQELLIDGEEARYDADISRHIHFKCTHCGMVYDIPGTYPEFSMPNGFVANTIQIFAWGYCSECNINKEVNI